MNIFQTNLDNSRLMNAIIELDECLKKMGKEPFDLNVVGGFALIVRGIRSDVDQVTDVDYIGSDLSQNVKNVADTIGIKYGVGRGWINNDLMLTGTTLKDIEFATGPLHFTDGIDLSVIRLKILEATDLLRMKLISLDTSLSAVEFGGDFTRMKDLDDIIRLKNYLGYDYIQMEEEAEGYLMSDFVFDTISAYEVGGYQQVLSLIREIQTSANMINEVNQILKEEGDFIR